MPEALLKLVESKRIVQEGAEFKELLTEYKSELILSSSDAKDVAHLR